MQRANIVVVFTARYRFARVRRVHAETPQNQEMILRVGYLQSLVHVHDASRAQIQRAGATNCIARLATLVQERVKRGDLLQDFGGMAMPHDFFPAM